MNLLMKRHVPICFVNTLINWYSKLYVSVKWNNMCSTYLSVKSGVRQGGVLSPALFNIYMDVLILALKKLGHGCHLDNEFFGCICYADDMILLCPSMIALQKMLTKCDIVGTELGLKFNGTNNLK